MFIRLLRNRKRGNLQACSVYFKDGDFFYAYSACKCSVWRVLKWYWGYVVWRIEVKIYRAVWEDFLKVGITRYVSAMENVKDTLKVLDPEDIVSK